MTADKMTLAVNHALRVQSQLDDMRVARLRAMAANPGGGLDQKRPGQWCEFGFPDTIGKEDLVKLWRRGGIAFGAIEKIVGNCWTSNPELVEDGEEEEASEQTPWEKATAEVLNGAFWLAFAEADKRRLVARYAGLVLRIADGRPFDQPVTSKSAQLRGVIPVWSTALKPVTFNTDQTSDDFGQPTIWEYTTSRPDGTVGQRVNVHADRVFILGDWASDAVGFLEPSYNNFVNLEKVSGGSAEGLLKNSARQLNLNFDKGVDLNNIAAMYGVPLSELRDQFQSVARDLSVGNDTLLVTQGATSQPLVADVPDPKGAWEINVSEAAAGTNIPQRILVGNQSGERASSEDRKEFNATCQSRREKTLSPEILRLAVRLQRFGVLGDASDVVCAWDDLREATRGEKLANAKTMQEINTAAVSAGDGLPFDLNEIRVEAGFEPLAEQPPMPEGGPDDGDQTPPAAA